MLIHAAWRRGRVSCACAIITLWSRIEDNYNIYIYILYVCVFICICICISNIEHYRTINAIKSTSYQNTRPLFRASGLVLDLFILASRHVGGISHQRKGLDAHVLWEVLRQHRRGTGTLQSVAEEDEREKHTPTKQLGRLATVGPVGVSRKGVCPNTSSL